MADKPVTQTYGYLAPYIKKYLAKQAEIKLRMPPERKEAITAAAAAAGESVNAYILDAVQQRMEAEDSGDGANR